MVDEEAGWPGQVGDGIWMDVAMRARVVGGEEEAIVGSVVVLEVEGDAVRGLVMGWVVGYLGM